MRLGKMYNLPSFKECSVYVFDIVHLKWYSHSYLFFYFSVWSIIESGLLMFPVLLWAQCRHYGLLSFYQSCFIWFDVVLFVICMLIVVGPSWEISPCTILSYTYLLWESSSCDSNLTFLVSSLSDRNGSTHFPLMWMDLNLRHHTCWQHTIRSCCCYYYIHSATLCP